MPREWGVPKGSAPWLLEKAWGTYFQNPRCITPVKITLGTPAPTLVPS